MPALSMTDLGLHLGLERLAIPALVSIMDVKAALSPKALGVRDDHTAGAATMGPSSIHETVVVTDVATVDAFHANGITTAGHHHVRTWPAHDAIGTVGATSCKVAVRDRWMMQVIKVDINLSKVFRILEDNSKLELHDTWCKHVPCFFLPRNT